LSHKDYFEGAQIAWQTQYGHKTSGTTRRPRRRDHNSSIIYLAIIAQRFADGRRAAFVAVVERTNAPSSIVIVHLQYNTRSQISP